MTIPVKCRFLAIALLIFTSMSGAQQASSTKDDKTKPDSSPHEDLSNRSFESLLHERDTLTGEIGALTDEIRWVQDAIAKRGELERAKSLHKPDKVLKGIEDEIDKLEGYAHLSGTAYNDLDKQLDVRQTDAKNKQQLEGLIDAELVRRADIVGPQQTFKLKMSITFASLVGLVIIGFFVIALRDQQVSQEIFKGQAGIQFVTLFSLVIAIILFGIIDILGGKELAALLGGLSGYILGRSTSTTSGTGAAPDKK
jgi:hypothetical protein